MIEPAAIDALRASTDLVALIGRSMKLTRRGKEWWGVCIFHKESTPSFKVSNERGRYHCFGCEADGDCFTWIEKTENCTFPQAVERLSNGHAAPYVAPQREPDAAPAKKVAKPTVIMPVPADAPGCQFLSPSLGSPTFTWAYRNAAGELLGHVARYDPPGEARKVFQPHVFTDRGWRNQGFPSPRPLYGLDRLAARPDAPVLVVEGEKKVEPAEMLAPRYVTVAWHGGASAVKQTDWSPLKGRDVVCWPDADDVGINAMRQVIKLLGSGRIVELPEGLEKGADLADNIWTAEQVAALLEPPVEARGPMPADAPDEAPEPLPEEPEFDPDRAAADLPFAVLGHRHGIFYYIPGEGGDVITMTAAGHNKANLLGLAQARFWEDAFMAKGREGWDAAANSLIRQSYRAGIFDPTRLRGRGAWWDAGRVVVHLGDRLVVDGIVTPLKSHKSEFLYEVGPKIRLGDADPLSSQQAGRLLELCKLLNWERPISAYLLAGWCALAPICGALQWRPSIFVSGQASSGKSWVLSNIIGRVVGNAGLALASSVSEPGIRRALGYDAMPVVIDELEARDPNSVNRIESIMGLIRYSSSETDAMIVKGSNSGAGVEYFRIRSMFCTAAVGSILNDYADVTRNTVLTLRTVHGTAGAIRFAQIEAMQQETMRAAWIDGLRSRVIGLIPVIRANAETFSVAGAKVLGTRRLGDQLGTLIAGAYALTSRERITAARAEAWLALQDWSEEKEIILDTDGPSCFARIMEHQVQVESRLSNGHVKRSLGELMAVVAKQGGSDEIAPDTAASTGKRHGIVFIEHDGAQFVAVSNTHSEIRKILHDSPWSSNWSRRLRTIKGALASPEPVSFGKGAVARVIMVPFG